MSHRNALSRVVLLSAVLVALALGGCTSGATQPPAAAPPTADLTPTSEAPQTPEGSEASPENPSQLPERQGERRATTGSVPHVQLDAGLVPDVDAELRRRAFLLPGVVDQESTRSLPGARGLVLSDQVDFLRPDVTGGSREFAHIHPDGSLHVWLPVDRALEVDETKWGELHPWVVRDDFWNGVAMIYTPETFDELDITIQLLVDAYNFLTGSSLEPSQID